MDPVHRTVTPDPGNPAGLDYAAFLRDTLATQPHNLAAYVLTRSDGSQPPEQVWLKKAGPHLGAWRATLLGAVARLVRLEALRPVPNPGGRAAIHTEARRLAALHARGLRVPTVLAVQDDALLLRHLGEPGAPTKSLADELYDAARDQPAQVLPLWQQGLEAVGLVHDAGACLSQAFARNLVRCPAGVVGDVDFEDDPEAALPLLQCQVRDLMCYAHSSGLYLQETGHLKQARDAWQAWLAQRPEALQAQLRTGVARMGWMRRLPQDRSLGRDLLRARVAYDLMN